MPKKINAYIWLDEERSSKILVVPQGKKHIHASFDLLSNSFETPPSNVPMEFEEGDRIAHKAELIKISPSVLRNLKKAAGICDLLERSLQMSRRLQ